MKVKKCLVVFVVLFLFSSSLAIINVPVKVAAPPTPYVKVYVNQPLGYIPGKPVGEKVNIQIRIEVANIIDNTAQGIVTWGIYVQVDPNILNITRAKGATTNYFLYNFSADYGYPYPGLLSYLDSATGFGDIAESISPTPPGGAGENTSTNYPKLVTLEFTSKSETAYSKIDLFGVEYMTPDGRWHAANETVDGHYNEYISHNLTVESTPMDGIDFTIDSTGYATNQSVILPEGNRTVTMPSTWMNGNYQYNFVKWEDDSTNPVRVVSLTSNITIIATYELATKNYNLTVNSEPITGVNFKIDTTTYATNTSVILLEGSYTVTMPSSWVVGTDHYIFKHWNDTSTNPVRNISLTSNITIIATYELYALQYPAIYIEPAHTNTTLTPGENFTISIKTNYAGTDISNWQFTLTYNPLVLHGVNITNGDLITKAKNETAAFLPGSFDNTEGKLNTTAAFFFDLNVSDPHDVGYGPGTLAKITFTVVGYGKTNMTFGRGPRETSIGGWNFTTSPEYPYGQPYTIIDAYTMPDHVQDASLINIKHTPMLYMAVIPESTVDPTLTPGKNYTVSIYTNYNGSDIWGYDLTLTYNPLVLEGVEVVNGDLITEGDVSFIAGTFNNTIGRLGQTTAFSMNQSAPLPYPPVNNTGPGVLANVTFTIVGEGESLITIVRGASGTTTKLKLTDGTNIIDYLTHIDPDPTKGKFLDGFFQNTEGVVHDIAVTKIDFSPDSVTAGEPVNINVTIRNEGTVTEMFDVEVWYGYNPLYGPVWLIGTKNVSNLAAGANKTLTFTWNTTEVLVGNYTITAVASTVSGETDTDDNTLQSDEMITVLPAHVPPVASFTYSPSDPVVGETMTFDASASYDPDGTIVNYAWDFGDGTTINETDPITTHAYANAGTYIATLTVTDNDGLSDANSKLIIVGKLSSSISITASPITIRLSENTTISGLITPTRGNAVVTIWHRLSGDEVWIALVTLITDSTSQYSFDWTPTMAGTFELKASWPGDTNTFPAESSIITITVIPLLPPVASLTWEPEKPYVGDSVVFDASLSSDPDGTIVSYALEFGDGTTSNATEPIFEHSYNQTNTYTVTLTVTDNDGLTNTATAYVTVVHRMLSVEVSGEFDYLLKEEVEIKIAALVRDVATMESVSNANVNIQIYDNKDKLLISSVMNDSPSRAGIYIWTSIDTIKELRLEKGVYLVCVEASFRDGPTAYGILLFHVDPLVGGTNETIFHIALIAIVFTIITGLIFKRQRIIKGFRGLNRHIS